MITEAEYKTHLHWMKQAIAQAIIAGNEGEIPVGAVIVDSNNQLIALGRNHKEKQQDPTAHAEAIAIRAACEKRQDWRLDDCNLYVTLEPCPMCTGSIIHARFKQIIYGTEDPKTGVLRSTANFPDACFSNHRLTVISGIAQSECQQLLQQWFMKSRQSYNILGN